MATAWNGNVWKQLLVAVSAMASKKLSKYISSTSFSASVNALLVVCALELPEADLSFAAVLNPSRLFALEWMLA